MELQYKNEWTDGIVLKEERWEEQDGVKFPEHD